MPWFAGFAQADWQSLLTSRRLGLLTGRRLLLDMLPDDKTDATEDEQESEPEDAVADRYQQVFEAGKGGEEREE